MLACFMFVVVVTQVQSVVRNASCPIVTPRELDWKELDGKWYIAAVATDLQMQGDCATLMFNHKGDDTTDVSISSIANNTVSYFNGTVSLTVDSSGYGDLLLVTYTDEKAKTYSFLDVDYEHYAVIFGCYNNADGNSSTCKSAVLIYDNEIWKLTRTLHLKASDRVKLDQAVANYSLQYTKFIYFNNTEDTCWINGGTHLNPASLILTSAAALTLFRRLY